jgi:hypothetical protein
MIIQFPRNRAPDPIASATAKTFQFWFSFWFWWLPQARHEVVQLDDHRTTLKRKRANA